MSTELFAQSASGVNFANGVFTIYFVGQQSEDAAQGQFAKTDKDLKLKAAVHLPATGFLFMVSMIKNLLDNPQLSKQLDAMASAGLIPVATKPPGEQASIGDPTGADESRATG